MTTRPTIREVVYRRGMTADPSNWRGLKTTTLRGDELSDKVTDAIFDNDLLGAGGVYGIPDAGEPVQITSLELTHDHGITAITVYNLAIVLFHTNDDIYLRVIRLCSAIEKQVDPHWLERGRVQRTPPEAPSGDGPRPQPGSAQESQRVYRIKVTLSETRPPIWRRFVVPANVTLHRLHLILQDVMGWTNSHLYRFQVGAKEYGEPDPDNEFYELDFKNSRRTKLGQLMIEKGGAFLYEYDFGDGWLHELVVEDIFEREPGVRYPACLAGKRACPPEDCGGTDGYEKLLDIVGDPAHEEYSDTMTWLGGHFDPEEFDLEKVNNKLSSMRL